MSRIPAIFTMVFVLIMNSIGMAQAPKAYLDMDPGFFEDGSVVTVNGRTLPRSIWVPGRYYGLAAAMKDNPQASRYAEKHDEYAVWSGVALWGGLGGAITYILAARGNVNYGIYWGVFGAGLITSIALQKASLAYLYKAINSYNGTEPSKQSRFDFSIAPVANGAALGLNYSF